jgi:3-phosphoshikimate 1-carboxyvinyltransferase
MSEELQKVGCIIQNQGDSLEMDTSSLTFPSSVTFDSHGDHRIAMALAPLALKTEGVIINQPGVVAKSYPHFWEELTKAGFKVVNL